MSDQLAAETENKRDCIISGDNKVTIENGSLNALNPGARYRLRNEGATADWANHGLGQWEYWTIRKIGGEGCIQSGDWVYFESHRRERVSTKTKWRYRNQKFTSHNQSWTREYAK